MTCGLDTDELDELRAMFVFALSANKMVKTQFHHDTLVILDNWVSNILLRSGDVVRCVVAGRTTSEPFIFCRGT